VSDYRSVLSIVIAVCLLQIASGIIAVVTPLSLEAMTVGPYTIGIVAACYSAGFMVGAMMAPRLIGRVGHIRAFAACAGIGAAATLALFLAQSAFLWAVVRFIMGVVIAGLFTAAESWIAGVGDRTRRGAVVSFYQVLTKASLALGPFLLAGSMPLGAEQFVWAGIAFALCAVPMAATHQQQPPTPSIQPLGLPSLARLAPAAVFGVFLAGLTNTGVLSFLPLFAAASAPNQASTAAATVAAATWIGSMLSQWPAGKLSDRIDRRAVTLGLGVIAGLASLPLALFGPGLGLTWVTFLAFLWGAGALSFYGILVALAADRSKPEEIARVIAGLLFVWAGGAVVGPLIAGVIVASPLGLRGVFVQAILGSGLLIALMIWRLRSTDKPAGYAPFHNATQTSVMAAEADPRSVAQVSQPDKPEAPPVQPPPAQATASR